jgi:hypothetical protein
MWRAGECRFEGLFTFDGSPEKRREVIVQCGSDVRFPRVVQYVQPTEQRKCGPNLVLDICLAAPLSRIYAEREFREESQVLVATEAAGEGINLQFCVKGSPWMPRSSPCISIMCETAGRPRCTSSLTSFSSERFLRRT